MRSVAFHQLVVSISVVLAMISFRTVAASERHFKIPGGKQRSTTFHHGYDFMYATYHRRLDEEVVLATGQNETEYDDTEGDSVDQSQGYQQVNGGYNPYYTWNETDKAMGDFWIESNAPSRTDAAWLIATSALLMMGTVIAAIYVVIVQKKKRRAPKLSLEETKEDPLVYEMDHSMSYWARIRNEKPNQSEEMFV
jgi:hypothetical protein